MGKYVFSIQLTGHGNGPMEAWENAKENFHDDPLDYDDVQDTFVEETNERDPEIVYYQPKTGPDGKVDGHDAWVFSSEVWKSKDNLIADYPNCQIVEIKHGEIELPIFVDG